MNVGQVVTVLALVVAGFTACAEFGSYAFVHPVIRRLPFEHHVAVEQGLVRTFGRFMPVAMPASFALLVAWSVVGQSNPWLEVAALVLWGAGLVTTIVVNVAINRQTARLDVATVDAEQWRAARARWELFQAFRSWAFLLSFVIVCVATGAAG
ncbi:MAG: DUF1772 domain-containing protein [Streptosporangiales bacterium]|nr:DUF1772 domain-containing protein [Streptosporangiales bacterium]